MEFYKIFKPLTANPFRHTVNYTEFEPCAALFHEICEKYQCGFWCLFFTAMLVKVDARLIMQVLINLVDNAIKYTPPGSEIVIETRREGKKAVGD